MTIGRGIATYPKTIIKNGKEVYEKHDSTVFESAYTVILISVFFIFAIYSSVQALRLTTRPGISREMRKHFAYSHIIYIIVYLLSWMVYYFAAYYLMFYVALFGNNFQLSREYLTDKDNNKGLGLN